MAPSKNAHLVKRGAKSGGKTMGGTTSSGTVPAVKVPDTTTAANPFAKKIYLQPPSRSAITTAFLLALIAAFLLRLPTFPPAWNPTSGVVISLAQRIIRECDQDTVTGLCQASSTQSALHRTAGTLRALGAINTAHAHTHVHLPEHKALHEHIKGLTSAQYQQLDLQSQYDAVKVYHGVVTGATGVNVTEVPWAVCRNVVAEVNGTAVLGKNALSTTTLTTIHHLAHLSNLFACPLPSSAVDRAITILERHEDRATGGLTLTRRDVTPTLTSTLLGMEAALSLLTLVDKNDTDVYNKTSARVETLRASAWLFLRLARLSSGVFRDRAVVYEDEIDGLPIAGVASSRALLLAYRLGIRSTHRMIDPATSIVRVLLTYLHHHPDVPISFDQAVTLARVLDLYPRVPWNHDIYMLRACWSCAAVLVVLAVLILVSSATLIPQQQVVLTISTALFTGAVVACARTTVTLGLTMCISCLLAARMMQNGDVRYLAVSYTLPFVLMVSVLIGVIPTSYLSGEAAMSLLVWDYVLTVVVSFVFTFVDARTRPEYHLLALNFATPFKTSLTIGMLYLGQLVQPVVQANNLYQSNVSGLAVPYMFQVIGCSAFAALSCGIAQWWTNGRKKKRS